MARFNIEGMNFEQARSHIEENLSDLLADFEAGDMKAGRYIGVYYLMEAALRGDITSQVAVGSLFEEGTILDQDMDAAKYWYAAAIAQDHPRQDGTMLAAAASRAMQRLEDRPI